METSSRPRTWIILGVLVAIGFLLYQFWVWEVTRIEVPAGSSLVLINYWGKDLPNGEIVAPNSSYKGIQLKVLPEGTHFINPLLQGYEIFTPRNPDKNPIVQVPPDKCLILTRLYGEELTAEEIAQGDILVDGDEKPLVWHEPTGQWVIPTEYNDSTKTWTIPSNPGDFKIGKRGILRDPLGPATYYLNPHAYQWKLEDMVTLNSDQVGVRVLKVGKNFAPLAKPGNQYLVPEGFRGVQEKIVTSNRYINPYREMISKVNVQSVTVRLTDITFPSTDGFLLNPHVFVKFHVDPEMAPNLLVTLTDEGHLHQQYQTKEDRDKNEILQKIILPLIRGYVRIEGSKFSARELIAASEGPEVREKVNAREKLQKTLKEVVPSRCKEVGLIIEDVTLDQLEPQGDVAKLSQLITDRGQSRLKLKQNLSLLEQYKTEQKLMAAGGLKEQETDKVTATIKLEQAKIKAMQRKEVEQSKLETELANAQIKLNAAKQKAKAILATGEAEAKSVELQNDAEISGLKKAIQGFPNPDAFAQYHIMSKIAPALSEIFASDTSEYSKLFSGYLANPNPRPTGTTGSASSGPSSGVNR